MPCCPVWISESLHLLSLRQQCTSSMLFANSSSNYPRISCLLGIRGGLWGCKPQSLGGGEKILISKGNCGPLTCKIIFMLEHTLQSPVKSTISSWISIAATAVWNSLIKCRRLILLWLVFYPHVHISGLLCH